MRIGTKSVLYGAHAFWLHPWFVALAWWKLYGFPWDARLWVAFFVHDLGYVGCPNMDGEEGEWHVAFGAKIMQRLFDEKWGKEWYQFAFYHSRYMSKRYGVEPSRLCYADKLAFVITPWWIYVPCVWLTGEWQEYANAHRHETGVRVDPSLWQWYDEARRYTKAWGEANRYGQEDTWTKDKPGPGYEGRGRSIQGGRDKVQQDQLQPRDGAD